MSCAACGFFNHLSTLIMTLHPRRVNGNLMATSGDGAHITLPSIEALSVVATEENYVVPASSYSFAVYSAADAPACK